MERQDPSLPRTTLAQPVAPSYKAPPVEDGYTIDPASDYFTTDTATRNTKRAALVMLLVGGMTFGSFLWLRMRLVSDLPRQAYAEPDAAQASRDPSSNANPNTNTNTQDTADPANLPDQLPDHLPKHLPDEPVDASPYSVNDASGGAN